MVPMSGPSNFRYDPSHQFDRLSSLLNTLPTSEWVHPLRCEIKGYPSFFPGGRGYLGPAFPQSPVMLIGHNFDNKENLLLSVARGYEEEKRQNTWGILREFFLPVADLAEQDCFFTNFYLGAIIHPEPEPGAEKKTSNTGHFKCSPSREEAANYREACVDALRQQVETVRPSVVALLGSVVPRYFSKAFPLFLDSVARARGGQSLELLPGYKTQVVPLNHPTNPRGNDLHRQQGEKLKAAILAQGNRR